MKEISLISFAVLTIIMKLRVTSSIKAQSFYCNLNPKHILCLDYNCPLQGKCKFTQVITRIEQENLTELFNVNRNQMAKSNRIPCMRALVWHFELAYFAQCIANSCGLNTDVQLRNGEFFVDKIEYWSRQMSIQNATKLLIKENQDVIKAPDLMYIGCGKMNYVANDTKLIFICILGPTTLGLSIPSRKSRTASECSRFGKHATYENLCATPALVVTANYIKPTCLFFLVCFIIIVHKCAENLLRHL